MYYWLVFKDAIQNRLVTVFDVTIDSVCLIYFVQMSRTGKNGTISVRALDGPKASIVPATFSAVSPPGYTILDVDANAMLFVGGLTGKIKVIFIEWKNKGKIQHWCIKWLFMWTLFIISYSKNSKNSVLESL